VLVLLLLLLALLLLALLLLQLLVLVLLLLLLLMVLLLVQGATCATTASSAGCYLPLDLVRSSRAEPQAPTGG
jgi:hypothetical protein